ncbi:MAG: hypothetical protein HYX97_04480, partial [Chloroflexi bacterium]|nr:hypothetical protein [Chloroflexota bacterium]
MTFTAFAPVLASAAPVSAQASPIRVVSEQPKNNFPEGVIFNLEVASVAPIRDVALRFFVGTRRVVRFARPAVTVQGNSATAQYTLRLSGAQYSPPGTLIEYWYEVTDTAGNSLETPHRTFEFADSRFTWQQVQEGPFTVFYYGPVRTRAETALRVSVETNEHIGRVMQVQITTPWRIFIYN